MTSSLGVAAAKQTEMCLRGSMASNGSSRGVTRPAPGATAHAVTATERALAAACSGEAVAGAARQINTPVHVCAFWLRLHPSLPVSCFHRPSASSSALRLARRCRLCLRRMRSRRHGPMMCWRAGGRAKMRGPPGGVGKSAWFGVRAAVHGHLGPQPCVVRSTRRGSRRASGSHASSFFALVPPSSDGRCSCSLSRCRMARAPRSGDRL